MPTIFSHIIQLCEKCNKQIGRFIQYLEQRPNTIREDGMEYNV